MGRRKLKTDSSNKHGGNESMIRGKDGRKKSKPSMAKANVKHVRKPQTEQPVKVIKTFLPEGLKGYLNPNKIIEWLYRPCPPSSLAVARFFFGLLMVIDIPDERGLFEIDVRFGNPMKCHFPLFDWVKPLKVEYMGLLYFIMWMGAAGICVGYHYQASCIMFALPYWYLFLLDKTTWNNHSYLYGLLSILFTFCSANHAFSVDMKLRPSIRNQPVPFWNYAILRFQFFLLYFYAGIKKFDRDWIGGHSMTRLGLHWVFDPFRFFLTNEQIDFWIIHIFGFVFDLTIGFFLLIDITRPFAIVVSTAFHLMNSRLFHIGQFPYVCLSMTPIFCNYNWPDRLWNSLKKICTGSDSSVEKSEHAKNKDTQKQNKENQKQNKENQKQNKENQKQNKENQKQNKENQKQNKENQKRNKETQKQNKETQKFVTSFRQKFSACLLAFYVSLQLFLPFSHFITKGYNNWTNGLYGYSWDMMVHNWDSVLTVIKVVDNDSGEDFFIDPEAWVMNSRFTQHGDMLIQYAQCLKRNLPHIPRLKSKSSPKFKNISIYIDSWCSLNGRFQQRLFNPKQDLLEAEWSPFEPISWLMPLLSKLTPWRERMIELEKKITEEKADTGVLFVADFPGLYLNNYIVPELKSVTLTVLQGTVILEKRVEEENSDEWENVTLDEGDSYGINSGEFHKVHTVSDEPSCYMYTFINESARSGSGDFHGTSTLREYDTFLGSLKFRLDNLIDSLLVLRSCFRMLLQDLRIPLAGN